MSIEAENFLPEVQTLNAFSLQQFAREVDLEKLAPKEKEIGQDSEIQKVAVATQFAAAVNPYAPMEQNYLNAISFLQAQDAGLAQITQIFSRMSELKALSQSVKGGSEEMSAYEAEFQDLLEELKRLREESFNGTSLLNESNQASRTSRENPQAENTAITSNQDTSTQESTEEKHSATIVITEAKEGDKISASVNGMSIDAVAAKKNVNETAQDLAESINTSASGVVATAAAGVVKVESEDRFSLEAKATDADSGISTGAVSVQGPEAVQPTSEAEKTSEDEKDETEEKNSAFKSKEVERKNEEEAPPFRLVGSSEASQNAAFRPSGFSTIIRWSP